MIRSELEYRPQRQEFTEAHPGAKFDHVGRFYIGHVPYTEDGEERSITVRCDSWRAVLDTLDGYFGGPDTG